MADLPVSDDEHYASSEDSDFAPDKAPEPASSAESDNDDDDDNNNNARTATATAAATKRKRATTEGDAEDVGFENSGDEAIISRGKKKQRRRRQAGGEEEDDDGGDGDDGGGVGGFVKTRSQRANEKAERRVAAVQGPVTVDVDALWAQMTGSGTAAAPSSSTADGSQQELASLVTAAVAAAKSSSTAAPATADESGDQGLAAADTAAKAAKAGSKPRMVKIKRTYNFAGKVHTEEKRVARGSAEAKLYFAETGQEPPSEDDGEDEDEDDADADADEAQQTKRLPPRKAFRSAFEPVLDMALLLPGAATATRRADLDLGLRARLLAREQQQQQRMQARAAAAAAKKLNTVEKSRMDWAGFVDREGIQDELVLAGKAKGAFGDRQQFLARTDMLRDEEARRARMAGKT